MASGRKVCSIPLRAAFAGGQTGLWSQYDSVYLGTENVSFCFFLVWKPI